MPAYICVTVTNSKAHLLLWSLCTQLNIVSSSLLYFCILCITQYTPYSKMAANLALVTSFKENYSFKNEATRANL